MMFPLHFHYEDISRQDPLLKPNHLNVMEVPGLKEIRLVPDFRIQFGKLAMEIISGQRLRGPSFKAGKCFGKERGYVSDFARQRAVRGHGISHFLVRISTVMSMLDFPVEIRENPIKLFLETPFCEFSPELLDHFEIFQHIRGFNVTILTSTSTKDETLPPWSGFLLKDEGV
nr:ribosomal protein L5 [Xyris indica]